jgi:hypothetical protein
MTGQTMDFVLSYEQMYNIETKEKWVLAVCLYVGTCSIRFFFFIIFYIAKWIWIYNDGNVRYLPEVYDGKRSRLCVGTDIGITGTMSKPDDGYIGKSPSSHCCHGRTVKFWII